jgi:hypothetical protein
MIHFCYDFISSFKLVSRKVLAVFVDLSPCQCAARNIKRLLRGFTKSLSSPPHLIQNKACTLDIKRRAIGPDTFYSSYSLLTPVPSLTRAVPEVPARFHNFPKNHDYGPFLHKFTLSISRSQLVLNKLNQAVKSQPSQG